MVIRPPLSRPDLGRPVRAGDTPKGPIGYSGKRMELKGNEAEMGGHLQRVVDDRVKGNAA
jgi:hypothetical protein